MPHKFTPALYFTFTKYFHKAVRIYVEQPPTALFPMGNNSDLPGNTNLFPTVSIHANQQPPGKHKNLSHSNDSFHLFLMFPITILKIIGKEKRNKAHMYTRVYARIGRNTMGNINWKHPS